MTARKHTSRQSSGSDLARVDAHVIGRDEYKVLPELTGAMLARRKVNKGRRQLAANRERRKGL